MTRLLLALLALLTPLAALPAAASSPAAATTEELFTAGEPYTGTFADPSVVRVGRTYVAAATTTANLNLPLMTSTDLLTWRPREVAADAAAWTDRRGWNEAMPVRARWAAVRERRGELELVSQWAPSLARVGRTWVAAYSAAVRLEPRHSCIGIATAAGPLGPYTPRHAPLVCHPRSPLGAIDPDVFVDPRTGAAYLLWKAEGVPGELPARLVARRLDASGTRFAPGSRPRTLLRRTLAWEGSVVENPSMVRVRGRHLLVYSANAWRGGAYTTGYAVCDGPLGPCRKSPRPLMSSGGGAVGPGGGDAFLDVGGVLRLAYHSWDRGLRRLRIATLTLADGALRVVGRG